MNECQITKIDVSFSRSNEQSTSLQFERCANGWYNIEGLYQLSRSFGFPAYETIKRTGAVFPDDMEKLVKKLLVSCRQWYHHYRRPDPHKLGLYGSSSWSIRVECNGEVERWEGEGFAPHGLDNVYDELVAFGMPSLRLGQGWHRTFESTCTLPGVTMLETWHLTIYELMLGNLVRSLGEDGNAGELDLVISEFLEDITLYLGECAPEALTREAYQLAFGEGEMPSDLMHIDETKLDRASILTLYGTLVRIHPTREEMELMVGEGMLARWGRRMREIPAEERAERERAERKERMMLLDRIDASVRKFAAENKPFTSYDVAKDCGITAQQASGRIRNFVRRGEIRALEGELPRRYKAA